MAVRRAKRGRGKTGGRKRAAGKKARAKATRRKGAARKTRGKARKAKGAARKKVARKKAPRRGATRRKATRGKAPRRAATRKRSAAAPKKTVAAAPRKAPVVTTPERPSLGGYQPQTVSPFDAPASEENPEDVGTVVHYYPHVNAAIVRVERGGFRVGDTLEFQGYTTKFQQRVAHIELEHESVGSAAPGQVVGIQVTERVREHDRVRKVQ
jgi:hypothetical protein